MTRVSLPAPRDPDLLLDVEAETSREEREALAGAIDSMTPESLVSKGLDGSREAIRGWLNAL